MNGGCIHRVHEIRVLRNDAAIVRQRSCDNIGVADVFRGDDEIVPAWRVLEVDTRDFQVRRVFRVEEDGTVVFVVWVQNPERGSA